ncbi:TetR/AcrR family transcriptional regulator [Nonomuraea jiangxiensis]|uniref:DNA-binding transcriptional regulator, AcrR family n=1 Tax=Nonomuraea jiangxiensis TaxID=633440 RepID=A0A1G8Q9D8_9ACTN|nr:TetR/AcrR family transcriptional regulator [Nonomuraea jiangxiensis]SDJ01311.1 DNA-binding transcriptional regulator, AcrR family [Nonomuraea jiangxiensis]
MAAPSARSRRRADAERSIARIVSAARELMSSDPNATTDDIAQAAGVGRMTLYGHFRTRADLIEAALTDALRAGEETLASIDLTGDAREAMTRLLASSWELLAESGALLAAAEGVLPAGRVRELHAEPVQRMTELIHRGQEQGVFRTDLPTTWLVSLTHYILHGATNEVRVGRLPAQDAADVVTKSIQAALSS